MDLSLEVWFTVTTSLKMQQQQPLFKTEEDI